jgi:hypothetical protein
MQCRGYERGIRPLERPRTQCRGTEGKSNVLSKIDGLPHHPPEPMKTPRRRQNVKWLIVLIMLGIIYSSLLHFDVHLTGIHQIDGILGILLGLYSCAQPAANALDAILYGRYYDPRTKLSRRANFYWWGLNILILLVGWQAIVTGLLTYSAPV